MNTPLKPSPDEGLPIPSMVYALSRAPLSRAEFDAEQEAILQAARPGALRMEFESETSRPTQVLMGGGGGAVLELRDGRLVLGAIGPHRRSRAVDALLRAFAKWCLLVGPSGPFDIDAPSGAEVGAVLVDCNSERSILIRLNGSFFAYYDADSERFLLMPRVLLDGCEAAREWTGREYRWRVLGYVDPTDFALTVGLEEGER